MTRVSSSAEALGDFAIHANHRGAKRSVNAIGYPENETANPNVGM
jgi:hypothetical protein